MWQYIALICIGIVIGMALGYWIASKTRPADVNIGKVKAKDEGRATANTIRRIRLRRIGASSS